VNFTGSKSFDRNGSALSYHWDFGNGITAQSADTVIVFSEVGASKIMLTVTNEQFLSSKDSVVITVLGNGTPFSGSPAKVPGRIEAEHYDKGGEAVAYHDTEANNIGLAFRPDEGVDLEASNDQGFDVYWIVAGEWLEYTFEVEEAGEYDFTPYVSTVPGFGNFTLRIDNVDVSGKKPVLHTGGWQSWTPIKIENVPLEAGVHIMHFDFDSDTDKTGWLFSLNYIQVTKSTQVGIEESEEVPKEFSLAQNYPNPFNPATHIDFRLPVSGFVTLKIYNLVGQEVKTLVNQVLQPGNYSYAWNASGFASGVFYYR